MKIPISLLLVFALLLNCSAYALARSNTPEVNLSINVTQGTDVKDVTQLFLLACLANGWNLASWHLSMNLTVNIGGRSLIFHQNGARQINIGPGDQDYTIDGQSIVELVANDKQGREHAIRSTINYVGDGTIRLSDSEDNSTLQLYINTDRTRQTSSDPASGAGEFEYELSLQRSQYSGTQPVSQTTENVTTSSDNTWKYIFLILLIAYIIEENTKNKSEESSNGSNSYMALKRNGLTAGTFFGLMGNLGSSLLIKKIFEKRDFSLGVHVSPEVSFYTLANILNGRTYRNYLGVKIGWRILF